MIFNEFNVGDILVFKKNHPCGSNSWKVIRYGADCKLECVGCGHVIMLSRVDINKRIKSIVKKENKDNA